MLLRKHKKWFAVLYKPSVRTQRARDALRMYQCSIFPPPKEQRLEDFLGPGARHWGIIVLNPCLEGVQITTKRAPQFTHNVFIEVIPCVEGSEPSEAQKRVDVRSGSTNLASARGWDKHELCPHRVFVTGVPESIHRYLDRSLAAVRLARVVLRTKLDVRRWQVVEQTKYLVLINCASSRMTRYHSIRASRPL